MMSIKERGVKLKLAEKLDKPPASGGTSPVRPVQSTLDWNLLVSHLKSSVQVKCRRVNVRSHTDCFLGSDAVEVVTEHMRRVKSLEDADLGRDGAVCVLQVLMDCGVFEAVETKVFGKNQRDVDFEDSKNCLYRFVSSDPYVDEQEKVELMEGLQTLLLNGSALREQENTLHPQFRVQKSTPVRFTHTVKFKGINRPSADGCSAAPLVDTGGHCSQEPPIPQSLVEEVWQEQTLVRLLKLVELPLLDRVLQCRHKTPSPRKPQPLFQNKPDLIYSSNHLDRQILKAFRDSQEDEWLCAAVDCLDFLPDQPVVELSREMPHCFPESPGSCSQGAAGGGAAVPVVPAVDPPGLFQFKRLLYDTLVKHYSQSDRAPLLPQYLTDVYTAIADLLIKAKLSTALEALQLCLKLLTPTCRDQLRRLLTFMALAAEPQHTKLDKDVENRAAVHRSFSKSIVNSKGLSKDTEHLLLVFMLSNVQEIFKIPGSVHKGVSDKLAGLVQGKQPDMTDSALCQQVSSTSTKTTTHQELWTLLDSIYSHPKLASKRRKRLLQQFYQAHPEVFYQYFGDSVVSVI